MEYISEKQIHRQRCCLKCKSYVTHEKIEDGKFVCPLCGNVLPKAPEMINPMDVNGFRKLLAETNRDVANRNIKESDDRKAAKKVSDAQQKAKTSTTPKREPAKPPAETKSKAASPSESKSSGDDENPFNPADFGLEDDDS